MNKEKLTMIELFSGIGAQIRGIKNTNLWDCTVVNTSDIDKDAMVSYAAIHCGLTPELIDTYADYPSEEEMAKVLTERNIGFDFKKNAPYDWYKLAKRKGNEINKYYLACVLSKNLGDISSIKSLDYADFWTYSFPCQDISVAGKQAGIEKGKTRSGLLYEVERLLETAVNNGNQPKYLLLENVKNLVGKKFKPQFDEWISRLDELGYNTYWQVVNGKDCGIPQNRERCFAISIRKDIDSIKFRFAKCFDNGLRLKDLLEENVDEKYFLKTLGNFFMNHSLECEENGNGFRFKPHNPTKAETAFSVTTRAGGRMDDNYVNNHDISEEPFFEFNKKNIEAVNTASDGTARTIKAQYYKNGNANFTRENGFGATGVADNFKIRKLTPTECWRLMGFEDNDVSRAKSIGMSDSALYKQAGNSIITNCISLIMEHLYKAQVDNTYICTDENFTQPQQK